MTQVLEEVAQDFEGLDSDTLALRGQELADHPVRQTDDMSVMDYLRCWQNVKEKERKERFLS